MRGLLKEDRETSENQNALFASVFTVESVRKILIPDPVFWDRTVSGRSDKV